MAEATPDKKYDFDVSKLRTNKKVKRHKVFRYVIIIILLLTILFSVWGVIYTITDKNSYRIKVSGSRAANLSLSFDRDFKTGFSLLRCAGPETLDDTKETTYTEGISKYIQDIADGTLKVETTDGGQRAEVIKDADQYIATKIYLKNTDEYTYDELSYKVRIDITERGNYALAAARFMIVIDTDGERQQIVAALPNSTDGQPEKVATESRTVIDEYVKDPNDNTKDWLCSNILYNADGKSYYYDTLVCDNISLKLKPLAPVGFVIAMWFEGSDPDHNADIMKSDISFSVSFETIKLD